MKLYSTKNRSNLVSLKEAVLKGLPPDNGLFMPSSLKKLPDSFFNEIKSLTLQDIAFQVSNWVFEDSIPVADLDKLVKNAFSFPCPLREIEPSKYILELFHGPSLAFKDFGARFMAQLMGYFNEGNQQELVILVATSGDTGGAVAAGFYNVPGIKVVILYPSGKVSQLQEKQLTTLGGNIVALEVKGTFDDCQRMVKEAFLDEELNRNIRLTSANSINIARLIPQSFYYFEAYKQLLNAGVETLSPVFVVPSGNFGNLTAGLLAYLMGLPVKAFVAATNMNDVIPEYLMNGRYQPKISKRTISNAMDVGAPSNFARMEDIFSSYILGNGSTWNNMKSLIKGFSFSDFSTKEEMFRISRDFHYFLDPHTAVGFLAAAAYSIKYNDFSSPKIVLGTAHPIKFVEDVPGVYFRGTQPEFPVEAIKLINKKKESVLVSSTFSEFRSYLMNSFYS